MAEQLEIAHPVEPALSAMSFIVFTAAPRAGGDARNATIVAPGRLDRSATGTATSARLAVLAARGLIGDGEDFVNESVIGTHFVGRIVGRTEGRRREAIVPAIPAARGSPARTSSCSTPTTRSRRGSDCPTPGAPVCEAPRPVARGRRGGAGPDALVEPWPRLRRPQRGRGVDAAARRRRGAGPGHGPADGAHRHGEPGGHVKLVSLYPGHDPAHQAAIMVFDAAPARPVALMDGDAITAARTAAGSRLATRLLARDDADVLAIIGTGVQGEATSRP